MTTYTLHKDESKMWYMTANSPSELVKNMDDAVSIYDREPIVRDLLTWLEDNCDDNQINSIVMHGLCKDWKSFVMDVLYQMAIFAESSGTIEIAGLIEVYWEA